MQQDLRAIRIFPGVKVSHDLQGSDIKTFEYLDLWARGLTNVGLPCKMNNLLVIDVDVAGPTHQYDGREYWANFCREFGIPPTYTVQTISGGFHFYFWLPEAVNPETFSPPGQLAPGVDVKWNGWVGAPPSTGYTPYWGSLSHVQPIPPALMAEFARLKQVSSVTKTFDASDPDAVLVVHRPFNESQLQDLRQKIEWLQSNGTLSRDEWRNGLFSLKAGITDPVLLDELACRWTMNKSYINGDENEARTIIAKAENGKGVGPGTIFAILNAVRIREGAPLVETPFTIQEIMDRSRVHSRIAKDGSLIIETSESNAAALLGAIHAEDKLYHDIRSDLYIYKGKSHSDSELVSMFLPMIQSPAYGLGLEKFRKSTVAGGLEVLMASRKRDPHQEYLKELRWDGIPRIENFFTHYAGVPDSEYVRLVGLNFWTSLAARGLKPGCKFDSMVILEGSEGINKSSLIQAIAGQYTYVPSDKHCMYSLDILRQMHQSVITELPELIGLIGMDPNTVKGFLAKPIDHIRSLFARRAMENPRGFVFVGTTNDKKYLNSSMGARRFWPIEIPKGTIINLSGIKQDRDQLFAEGIAKFNEGHTYWHVPKELLKPIVEGKVVNEPLMGPIQDIIDNMLSPFHTADVYQRLESSGYLSKGLSEFVSQRLETALLRLGCERDGLKWRAKATVSGEKFNDLVNYSQQSQAPSLAAFL